MRVLLKKTQEGWKIRFPFGNPWKCPCAEWLSHGGLTAVAPAHLAEAIAIAQYPGCNAFTIVPIEEDLEQLN